MTDTFDRYGVDAVLEIKHGHWHAVVAAQGAAIKTLSYLGEPIVVVPMPVTDFAFVGSSLAPWANRLEDATWQLDGVSYSGEITEAGNHNGLHGLLVRRDFEVASASHTSVTFSYQFGADEVYPFAVLFEVTYQLMDAGLRVTMAATNLSSRRLPISFGSHPYFAVDETSQLKVSARKATVNSQRQLPIAEQSVTEIGLAHNSFVPITHMTLDDCLFDLGSEPRTVLSRPSLGLNVVVWQETGFDYQMLFVRGPKFAGSYPVTVAIEPQTSPANALASKNAVVWIEPSEQKSLSWGVSVESI